MVKMPAGYRWSSYHANAQGLQDDIVTPHYCYQMLGDTDDMRRQRYRDLFVNAIDEVALDEIRRTVNKGWTLGSERFKKEVESFLALKVSPRPRGGDRKSAHYLNRDR